MPYKYRHPDEMDSEEKIMRDRRKAYPTLPGCDHEVFYEREKRIRQKRDYLEMLEFQDQIKSRVMNFQVDLRNKYQIQNAIDILKAALITAENEVIEVPNNACDYYRFRYDDDD